MNTHAQPDRLPTVILIACGIALCSTAIFSLSSSSTPIHHDLHSHPVTYWNMQDAQEDDEQIDEEATRILDEAIGGKLEAGRDVRVTMRDGRTFRGKYIKEDRLYVVIRIAKIETRFDATEVRRIDPLKTFEEQYHDLKRAIRENDLDQRFQLAKWLYGRYQYELAAKELEAILDQDRDFPDARQLLRTTNKAIELQHSGTPQGDDANSGADNDSIDGATNQDGLDAAFVEAAMLTDDQINLLKVYEIDLDNPPRLIVSRETINEFFDTYRDHELIPKTDSEKRFWYGQTPADILDLMFQVQAREMYGKIRVRSEPVAFTKFRMNVHRGWLVNSCATTACHGGTASDGLFLFNQRSNNARTVYSNFLILERSKIKEESLLNYEEPEDSLLLQMGLPRSRTSSPHPPVGGWRPVFRDRSDPVFQKAVDWLESMYRPRPVYPVEYRLPKIGHRDGNTPDNSEVPTVEPGQDLVENENTGGGEGG